MDFEKKYNEALERAKNFHSHMVSDGIRYTVEEIFPELKMNEDELTWLTKYIEEEVYSLSIDIRDDEDRIKLKKLQKALAWLEKQKPVDNVEPKFKVGEWITDGEAVFHITSYSIDYGYQLETPKGTSFHFSNETVEKKYHLWSIEDAKDGDVLAGGDWVFIFRKFHINGFPKCHCHYDLTLEEFKVDTDSYMACGGDIYPATKEQRDFLFSKMKEAGYEWNANKKESKLLITNGGDFESENCEQKPTWSEKDESHFIHCVRLINNAEGCSISEQENAIEWLKSLKQRMEKEVVV